MALFKKWVKEVPTEAEFQDINEASDKIQKASNNEEEAKAREELKSVGRDYRRV